MLTRGFGEKDEDVAKKAFGDRLTQLREQRGWTRSVLARRLRVSPTAVFNWEENGTLPRPDTRSKIAKLFNTDHDLKPPAGSDAAVGSSIGLQLQQLLDDAGKRCASLLGIDEDSVRVALKIKKLPMDPSDDW